MLPSKPYLIGETAFHHEGDIEFLSKLVDSAVECGVDAIKFHLLFDVGDYMIEEHTAIDVIKRISIDESTWTDFLPKVLTTNIDIILLCNDVQSMRWSVNHREKFKITAVEIHATGINDIFLLAEASNFVGTVILGVGGCPFEEIKYAIDFLKQNGKSDILLMHGFQNYPTDYKDINLDRMMLLNSAFNLPVGYADHTDPNDPNANFISVLPQSKGFNVLEKHFTHAFGEKRIDSQAAVCLTDMSKIRNLMSIVYSTKGDDYFSFSEAERKYGNTGPMKKAIVARHHIPAGTILSLDDIAFKRTNRSATVLQKDVVKLVGQKTVKNIQADELIDISDIEYAFNTSDFTSQFFIKE